MKLLQKSCFLLHKLVNYYCRSSAPRRKYLKNSNAIQLLFSLPIQSRNESIVRNLYPTAKSYNVSKYIK